MSILDKFLLNCATYEDYVDSFTTDEDKRYQILRTCRLLIKTGHRTATAIYTEEEFYKRRARVKSLINPNSKFEVIFSKNMTSTDAVLQALARRESLNVYKKISTIIFMRTETKKGSTISGYIDFEHSLKLANMEDADAVDWAGVFAERVMLRPTKRDLSYFYWDKYRVYYNESPNYKVEGGGETLTFTHKGDLKKLNLAKPTDFANNNCFRTYHYSERYGYVILYDHLVQRRN